MSGLARIAILVATVMVSANSPIIVDATSVSQVIPQQQQYTLRDLVSNGIQRSLRDSPEQHRFRSINTRMVGTTEKQRTPPQSTNNNRFRLLARTPKEKRQSIRSLEIHQSSTAPQTYTKRVLFGYIPNRENVHPEFQSGYGSQTTVDLGLPSSDTTNFDGTGKFSRDSNVNEKKEVEPACFPFCFPRYNGRRAIYGNIRREVEEVHHNADSSHWFTTEPKYNQRRCFPFCLPHYSGKRTNGQTKQLTEAKVKENKRDFEERRSQIRRAEVFAKDKRGDSLLDKPGKQVERLYE